jgi:hypothetical protein
MATTMPTASPATPVGPPTRRTLSAATVVEIAPFSRGRARVAGLCFAAALDAQGIRKSATLVLTPIFGASAPAGKR